MASASLRRIPTSTRTCVKPSLTDSEPVSARRFAQRSPAHTNENSHILVADETQVVTLFSRRTYYPGLSFVENEREKNPPIKYTQLACSNTINAS